jgi:nucleotide-binding universal stress UspA family protein
VWKVGHAGENIAKMAESGKFDLLVMGSHGHGALGNLVMGSVATQVLAHCSVPVLLVR